MIKKVLGFNLLVPIICCLCYFGSVGPDYGRVSIFSTFEAPDLFGGLIFSFILTLASFFLWIYNVLKFEEFEKNKAIIVGIFSIILPLSALLLFLSENGFGGILDVIGFFPIVIIIFYISLIVSSLFLIYLIYKDEYYF